MVLSSFTFFSLFLWCERAPHHNLICPFRISFASNLHLTKRHCQPIPSCLNLGVILHSFLLLPPHQRVLFVPLPNTSFSPQLHHHLPDPNDHLSQSFPRSPSHPAKSHPHSHPHEDTRTFLKYQSNSGIPPLPQPPLLTRLRHVGHGLIFDHVKPGCRLSPQNGCLTRTFQISVQKFHLHGEALSLSKLRPHT